MAETTRKYSDVSNGINKVWQIVVEDYLRSQHGKQLFLSHFYGRPTSLRNTEIMWDYVGKIDSTSPWFENFQAKNLQRKLIK